MNMIFVDNSAVNNDGCELTMSVTTLTYTCTILKYWTYHTYTQYFNTAHNIYIGNTLYTCTILKYCTHTISSCTQTLQSTKYDSCIHFGGLFMFIDYTYMTVILLHMDLLCTYNSYYMFV